MSLEDAINNLREQVPAFAKEVVPVLVYLRRKMRGRITGAKLFPTIKDVEDELYDLLEDWDENTKFTENSFLRVEEYNHYGETRMRMMLIVDSEELAARPPNPGEDVEEE
ncbi:hypothetical protein ES707_18982 [subsurface metagenome]